MIEGLAMGLAIATGWARSLRWLATISEPDAIEVAAAVDADAAAMSLPSSADVEAVALVDDTDALFIDPERPDGPRVETLAAPAWTIHRVRPGEGLGSIAARYGVALDRLMQWNHLDTNRPLGRRRTLRVLSDRRPPAVHQVRTTVRIGESWDDLAARLHVDEHGLRVQNWRMREPVAGETVIAWVDPLDAPSFVAPSTPVAQEPLEITASGQSVGLPQRGKLSDGVPLPEHPLWLRGNPDHLFGSAHTIKTVHRAFSILRGEKGYTPALLIGAISKRSGGRFAPHRSHQSGRDIDIRLPLRPGTAVTHDPTADEVDWYATWVLIESFVATGEIEAVFLNEAHHERLYRAGRALGVAREDAFEIVRWPRWRGAGIVQHAEGHNAHLHVRVRCGASERACL